jgi:membrane-associated HD superfamily phosphohydrolase
MKKNLLKKIGIGLGASLVPFLVLAQTTYLTSPGAIERLVVYILNWISGVVFVISLIMLLWSAILFLTAGASETAHGKAKNVLIFAIVGIAVAILAYSIEPFLRTLFRAGG